MHSVQGIFQGKGGRRGGGGGGGRALSACPKGFFLGGEGVKKFERGVMVVTSQGRIQDFLIERVLRATPRFLYCNILLLPTAHYA